MTLLMLINLIFYRNFFNNQQQFRKFILHVGKQFNCNLVMIDKQVKNYIEFFEHKCYY